MLPLVLISLFLSTLSLRRATRTDSFPHAPPQISIHALLAESDLIFPPVNTSSVSISIHALLAESDLTIMLYDTSSLLFLSTLSLRRATSGYFRFSRLVAISIHALLAESDYGLILSIIFLTLFLSTLSLRRATRLFFIISDLFRFLSTLSLRRATGFNYFYIIKITISIHALLAESDLLPTSGTLQNWHFYPRSPCGERLTSVVSSAGTTGFLSTLSLRRATRRQRRQNRPNPFLSTLSLRRATIFGCWMALNRPLFLSTLSLRRATSSTPAVRSQFMHFYPRSPCGERR